MSYGLDLVRLPAGVDRYEAYKQVLEEEEKKISLERNRGVVDHGPIDPLKEQLKQRLAAALIARHPTIELYRRDYSGIAKARGVDEAEARRLFRIVELNEKEMGFQILLFDDGAGASFSFVGQPQDCTRALRVLWDCLEILESEGGFSTYDTQIDKVLDLKTDFETVLKYACGVDREKTERPDS
jgi:hypothetical protein